ncbi:hypothetical protein AXX17_AT1G24480 [Arabidopsis thaliana]|nr:hypothetical protein AXX17_AT1G24480 [Arabidopsis thaliana]
MASHPEKKYRGNVSSVSSFSIQVGKSCPLDSSVEETQIFSKTKRNQSVKSRGGLGESSGSKRIGSSSSRFSCGNVSSTGSSSSRFSREGNISTATKTLKLPC